MNTRKSFILRKNAKTQTTSNPIRWQMQNRNLSSRSQLPQFKNKPSDAIAYTSFAVANINPKMALSVVTFASSGTTYLVRGHPL